MPAKRTREAMRLVKCDNIRLGDAAFYGQHETHPPWEGCG